MPITRARVPTKQGSRYLQQLCKHWSHKMEVEFTAQSGTINFPDGAVLSLVAQSDTLDLTLAVADIADSARMQQVVADHLDRFAFREAPLTFNWDAAQG